MIWVFRESTSRHLTQSLFLEVFVEKIDSGVLNRCLGILRRSTKSVIRILNAHQLGLNSRRFETVDQPNRLFMGIFAPAVDYLVATNFRKKEMGWSINTKVADRFLADFGFKVTDLPNKGRLFEA